MTELQALRKRVEEEAKASQDAQTLLKMKNEDLFSVANEVSEMALFPELSPQPVMRFNKEATLVLANPVALKLLNQRFEHGNSLSVLFPETNDIDLNSLIEADAVTTIIVEIENTFFKAAIRGVSVHDFVNVYLSDITDLEQAKIEIEKAHSETQQLLASIPSILIGINRDHIITKWNRKAEGAFGYTASEVIGTSCQDMQCKIDFADGVMEGAFAQLDGECTSLSIEEARYKRPDESSGFLDMTITKVTNIDGATAGYLMLARDITQRKELEQQLIQSQKLESLGQLAAGVAHEINTPIQFVGDNTHFLASAFERLDKALRIGEKVIAAYEESGPTQELLDEMAAAYKAAKIAYMRKEIPFAIEESVNGLDQVASIVRGIKQFSHPGSKDKKLIDINECIQNTVTVSRNEWKYVADLTIEAAEDLPRVLAHANEINQVFLNMIVNAAHAIEAVVDTGRGEKGTITIKTSAKQGYVVIGIQDTGTGIPESVQNKIFDPFFTTKEPGKGTGQGLTIAHNVICNIHEGMLGFETEAGAGTTFWIRLPAETRQ